MEKEIWRSIPGLEGHYEASNIGRIRSVKRAEPHIMSQQVGTRGYPTVMICIDGKYAPQLVHRLVLMAFKGLPPSGTEACHGDGNQANNHIDNLRWGTHGENARDQVRHGTHRNAAKTHCPRGHEYAGKDLRISSNTGGRVCLRCRREIYAADVEARGGRRELGPPPKINAQGRAELVRLRDEEGWTFQRLADHFGVSIGSAHRNYKKATT